VSEPLSERQRVVGAGAARVTQPETQSRGGKQHRHFSDIARKASTALGSAWAFLAACALVLLWMVTGPLFRFSDAWQLVINTGTTIVTFLMVFLIQNTQNRDSRALHLKLDELIRSTQAARNQLIDLENCTDEEIARVEQEFAAAKGRRRSEAGTVQHKQ
jgi:low affinity Fe/Cu permease